MTYENTKNEEQGTNCKLIPSINDHPIFCENEKPFALRYGSANPEDSLQASLNFSALLSLSKGDEVYPLVKPLPTALEVLGRQGVPITVKLGFRCRNQQNRQRPVSSLILTCRNRVPQAWVCWGPELKVDKPFSYQKSVMWWCILGKVFTL